MDFTTVVTATVAGMSGIGGAYLGMRQQLQTVREQARAEGDREREKREEERRDRRFDARVETYHRFLDVERRLRRLLASSRAFSEDEYGQWSSEFSELYHLVALIGTQQVQVLADAVLGSFRSMDADRMRIGGGSFADDLKAAFRRHEVDLEQIRLELITAMRRDVAAPEPPTATPSGAHLSRPISTPAPFPEADYTVAIVSEVDTISQQELKRVVAAVQKQVSRDLAPAWGADAKLVICATAEESPPGSILVVLKEDINQAGAVAYHTVEDRRPLAFVAADGDWALALSHQCLEVLVCPQSDRYLRGISPKADQGEVQFLVQICDPCGQHGYDLDGVFVSDFCTPDFYTARDGTRAKLDHLGKLVMPRAVARYGYLSWYEPDAHHMWQVFNTEQGLTYHDLGYFENAPEGFAAVLPSGVGYFG